MVIIKIAKRIGMVFVILYVVERAIEVGGFIGTKVGNGLRNLKKEA